jgi:sortase A
VGRRKWLIILAMVLLIAGASIFSFPYWQTLIFDGQVEDIKEQFLDDIKKASDPESPYASLYAYLKAENERLFAEGQADLVDALSYQQPAVDLSAYGLKNNCIGFIALPTIGIELPLYLGASTENMEKGAVHLTNTSYPIGGENTNCVIAAHRGAMTPMFRNIHKIKLGDRITVTNFRETLTYKAVEIKIIKPSQSDEILIQPGRDLLTLSSCNPLGRNYQRYLLFCERVA